MRISLEIAGPLEKLPGFDYNNDGESAVKFDISDMYGYALKVIIVPWRTALI